jgi:hypothetical protein
MDSRELSLHTGVAKAPLCNQRVRLQAIRKSPRRPKKPRSQETKAARTGHVATAKLLMNRQAKLATP